MGRSQSGEVTCGGIRAGRSRRERGEDIKEAVCGVSGRKFMAILKLRSIKRKEKLITFIFLLNARSTINKRTILSVT